MRSFRVVVDFGMQNLNFPRSVDYTTPWSIIAFATLRKPAMLAPFT